MSNTLIIRKNAHSAVTVPSDGALAHGELAYNNMNGAGGKLYIGGKSSGGSLQTEDFTANIIAAIPKADDDGSTFGVAAFDNADFNATGGVVTLATTSTAAELNILDGATLDVSELNKLDGYTGSTIELNYVDTGASVGTAMASKVVTLDSNKDTTGIRNITTTGNVAVGGNLTVTGTTTSVNSTIVEVADVSLALAKNNSADVSDIGFYGKYVESSTSKYTGLYRDATDGVWKFYDSLEVAPHDASGVVSQASNYALGDLSVNIVSSTINCGTY
jgi:hypothetical protein